MPPAEPHLQLVSAAPPEEALYREALLRLPTATYTTDAEGRITFYNEAAAELWGRRPQIGPELWCGSHRIFDRDGRELTLDTCPMAKALKEQRPIPRAEIVIERPDGERRQVLAHPQPLYDANGRLVGAINVLVDVTELKAVQAELARTSESLANEVRTLASLHDLAMQLAGLHDAPVALQAILEAAVRIAGADFGLLWLHDRATGSLRPAASIGFDDAALRRFASVMPGPAGGASGNAFASGQRVEIEDVRTDARFDGFRETAARAGFRAVHSTPMLNRDNEVLGALSLHFREPHAAGRGEVQFTDMCARHAAEVVEAARVHAELRRADQRKDEFLATLAHELRNPLAPISNALQVLKRRPEPPHGTEALAVMERQLRHLVRLVDDLLDVSRVSLGKIELQRARIDLRDVLLSAAEAARPLLQEAGHELAIDLPVRPLAVNGDATRLAQVFSNLLNNAARYTPRGGHIDLGARAEADSVVAGVRDDGIGIPADMLEQVFEMFVQGRGPLERGGGLGIGLTLAKRLVEMHGGSVHATSAEGRGSEFVVRLPAAPATSTDAGEQALAAPLPLPGKRVLVVDDNRDAAETLALLLELLGHQTRTVHDGVQALEVAHEWRPHVVLLDIGMPRLDGYEVCRRLRRLPWGRELLLIALTGWGKAEDQRRSQEAGFDAHLVKPVEAERLEAVLRELLGRRGG